MGQPAFAITKGFGMGVENRAAAASLQQARQHAGLAPVCKMHRDPACRRNARSSELGGHPPRSPPTAVTSSLFKSVELGWIMHIRDRFGRCIHPRICGIQTINISEQDQLIGSDRCRNQGRQGVVISEAEFGG